MKQESFVGGLGYRLYKRYVRFWNEHLMFRHVHYLNTENVPALGEPCMIVSNHQNCANDPLVLLLGLENESHPYVIARGNVFSWHPLITKFFLWLGMLPAYRLDFDGAESLSKNAETIRISGGKMLEGNRLIMYPEGGHQDRHWLGNFSFGYTRMAFETAESDNFRHDIKILPCAHHYEDYFGVRKDVMITFGTPISLQPYYELYRTKPRTAQREVNKLVRAQIESLMLDIRDTEHYAAIDFLRTSAFGDDFAAAQGLRGGFLPDKLKADKALVVKIDALPDEDKSLVMGLADDLRKQEEALGLSDSDLDRQPTLPRICLDVLCHLLLLPLWLVSLYPGIFHYNIHRPFMRTDRMFTNSWRFIIPVVVGIPFFFVLTILVGGLCFGWWWQSVLFITLATYPLPLFALWQWNRMKRTATDIRLYTHRGAVASLRNKRAALFARLRKILDISEK